MQLLCIFLVSHLVMLVVTLWLTRIWAIGYITAFSLVQYQLKSRRTGT